MPILTTLAFLLSVGQPPLAVVIRHEGRPVPAIHLTLTERGADEYHAITDGNGVATFPTLGSIADLGLDFESDLSFDYAFPDWAELEIRPEQRIVHLDLVRSNSWVLQHSPRPCDSLLHNAVTGIYLSGAASSDEEAHGFVRRPDLEETCRTVERIVRASGSELPWLLLKYSFYVPPCTDERPRGIIDVAFVLHQELVSVAGQDFGFCPDYWVRWWNQTHPGECLPEFDPDWRSPF